jgi:Avidin family
MPGQSISGTWYSSAGSKLILEETGRAVTGEFHSTQGDGGFLPVFGSIDPDPAMSHRALSFSVSWADDETKAGMRSVTSYSGQYRTYEDGAEEIEVIFLLVDDTKSKALWKAAHISAERFTRTSPR